MKLSLNKSNKILKSLEKELTNLSYKIQSKSYIQIRYNKITDVVREKGNIIFEQSDFETLLSNYHLIESDIYNLKNAIDASNISIGMNVILKNIDRNKKLLEFYKELENHTTSQYIYSDEAIDTMNDDIFKMTNSEEIKDKIINVSIFKDKLLITKIIKLYKKELSNYEDKKFELNNSKSIDINLSLVSQELLGLTE